MSAAEQDGLPPGWAWASMSDLASYVTSGSRDWSEFYSSSGALFIRTQDINTNMLRWSESAFVELPEHVEGKRSLVQRGDMLITITGANVGKCALVEDDLPEAYVSQSVALVKLVDAGFGPILRLACLRPLGSGETVLQKLAYGLGRPVLSLKQIRELELPLPPLNEQKRIVGQIEALQARSSAAQEALDAIPPLLEKFRQSVLAAAFRGDLTKKWREAHPDTEPATELLARIRAERRRRWEEANPMKKYVEPEPVDAAGLPELPEGWCWAWLSDCGEVSRGKSKHRPRNDERLFGDMYPFIQTGDVARSGGRISKATSFYSDFGLAQSRLFPAGTVCITIAANIADSAVLEIPACFPDSVVGVIPDTGLLSSEFLEFYIRTAREDLDAVAPATAQKNINLAVLGQVAVPVPPLLERLEIERMVTEAMGFLDGASVRQSTVGAAVASLNQSILAKAFRGELVPQDPTDEPAHLLLERIRQARAAEPAAKRRKPRTQP